MALFTDDISINTLVGENAFLTGNLRVSGFIRVDGDIDGNLETSGRVIVSEKARVRGNITALSATVGGIVEGDIIAPEGVRLLASAAVIGDVVTQHIQIDENCLVHGQYVALKDEKAYNDAYDNWQNIKAIREKALFTGQPVNP